MNPSASDSTVREPELVITRDFDAPRELVWLVLTEAEHLQHWFGPRGHTVDVVSLDLRPGGLFHYSMRTRGGQLMWGRFIYHEIVPPERLVYVNAFADADGNAVRNPYNADWPLEMLITWALTEEDGRTTFTVRAVPYHATEAERKAFADGFPSVRAGWAGTLDVLADYLATL
jgi:uncharacterized protein YndB with AHSA1/START domain